MNRLAVELIGAALLIAAGVAAWFHHDVTEQKIGANVVIEKTTETKTAAAADNTVAEGAQADQLSKVVQIYEQKVSALAADNASLVGRLHAADALRPSGLPSAGGAACEARADPGLRAREEEAQRRQQVIDADLTAVLNAADANSAKVTGCAAAYESARQEAIKAAPAQ